MFEDNAGRFQSTDGSSHDAAQHYTLIRAVLFPIFEHYWPYILKCLRVSGLFAYADKIYSGIHNLTYNLTRGNPVVWKATVLGTIVSGYGFTYLANSCLVHAYLKTTLGLPCFVHTPEAVDKDSGDD